MTNETILKDKIKVHVMQDGEKQILVIPEENGFFGREGFNKLDKNIINELLKNTDSTFFMEKQRFQLMKKSSQTRLKIVDLFNEIVNNKFERNNFKLKTANNTENFVDFSQL